MDKRILERFAEVVIKSCINLQKGQDIIIKAIPEAYELVRHIVNEAYLHGARFVKVDYEDEQLLIPRTLYSNHNDLVYFPQWHKDYLHTVATENVTHIIIKSPNPNLYKNCSAEKVRALNKAIVAINSNRSYDYVSTAYPTIEWAMAVYPELSHDDALNKLWIDVISILHLDDNPILYWDNLKTETEKRREYLDTLKIKRLIFTSPKTNLEIGLVENCKWIGGYYTNDNGIKIMPNLPTQEIFTVPHKYKVNGNVTTTIPLNYNGMVINNATMEFKDGKIISFSADIGLSTLSDIINTDEGSCYLGEIALVDSSSSIYKSGKVFHTTLYDENAVCHMALGMSIASCVKGSSLLSDIEKDSMGLNSSHIHVDFMIGSEELDIDGIAWNEEVIPIMRKGKYMF